MIESLKQDTFFMNWAIQLGEKGRLTAPPNPWVGCVIVKEGEIVGEGFHRRAGQAHAEPQALAQAGPLAWGATAYVTLEPCPHHGRTPPCVHALLEAGIKRVVIPFLDPDSNVGGKGVEWLRREGIEVSVGICADTAAASLAPYLHHRKTGFPFVVLKAAMSLDGRTAAEDGSSKWITGEEARRDVHRLRAESQAIMIGSKTALEDTPQLTVRGIPDAISPLRVLIDSKGKVPPVGPLADTQLAPTLIITSEQSQKNKWEAKGAEVLLLPEIHLPSILRELGKRGVLQLLVEGGSHLHEAFLRENLVNRLVLYLGSCLIGTKGLPLFPNLNYHSINEARRLLLSNMSRFGEDVRLDYVL